MGPHCHNFRVVNRSQEHTGNGLKWIERCRCCQMVICEANFSVGYRTAEVRKSWFNREGELMKVTGESKVIHSVTEGKNGEGPTSQANGDSTSSQTSGERRREGNSELKSNSSPNSPLGSTEKQ